MAVCAKQIMRREQIGGANGDVHGARPIDAEARRVGGDEIQGLVAEFARIIIGIAETRAFCPG